jgi:hypothetical protein
MNLKLIGRIVAIILIVIYAILSINYIGFSYYAGEDLGSYVFWVSYSTIANCIVLYIFAMVLNGFYNISKALLIRPEFSDLNENYTSITRETHIILSFNFIFYWIFLFTIPLSYLVINLLGFPDHITNNFVFLVNIIFLILFIFGRTIAINRYWRKGDIANDLFRSGNLYHKSDLPLFTIKTQFIIWIMQILSFASFILIFLKSPIKINYKLDTFHYISIDTISNQSGKGYLFLALISVVFITFWIKVLINDIFGYEKVDQFFQSDKS